MNLLFVCSGNRLRSATAEAVFQEYRDVEAIGAGTNTDAETPVSGDIIFVMENTHKNKITKKYRNQLKGKRLIVLGIADNYDYMDPDLIKLLKIRIPKHVFI